LKPVGRSVRMMRPTNLERSQPSAEAPLSSRIDAMLRASTIARGAVPRWPIAVPVREVAA